MSHTYRALLALTDDELVAGHDAAATHTAGGTQYCLDELRRREQARTNALLVRLTIANAALAAVAALIAIVTLIVTS